MAKFHASEAAMLIGSPVVNALQIAAQVREFAQSEEKELVFPSGLSAGERNAAHSLAAGEGLGHESRGDEGNRALHLWKVMGIPDCCMSFF